ncbi:MAG: DNA replication protein DnaC, partial [Ruminococcus sp.]|nr:DNA replication protein DnaC [Ruminococcus sp.]
NIINTRLNAKRPVIINTNLNIEGIRRRYEERVVSRITAYKCFEFRGKDVRLQISNEKAAKKGSL